ncbi:hypothetical protein OHA61_22485 [Streptomyces sp. NBC_00885]|uniref:hypothetical protein n=1 Tax=Streptomyces sp. NBC_00885 TaxID=2975857 RepID=UPI00386F5244|nr:hypothetical protein OHA61_22485 [Streptomyces sp. NBC_00885]
MFSFWSSTTGWWIAAAAVAIVFGAVMQSWVTPRKWKVFLATVPSLAGGLSMIGDTAMRGEGVQMALQLYTIVMLGILMTMAVFTKYIRRQVALVHAGGTMERATPKHVTVFLGTWFVVTLTTAAALGTLLDI